MSANLFKNSFSSCLSEEAQEELQCLGITVKETGCTIENAAPYSQDLDSLLQSYPVFSLDLSLNENGLLFNSGDRAIFVENDGYQVSLRQAEGDLQSYIQAANPESWQVLTRFRIDKKYELYSLQQLLSTFPLFYDDKYMKKWGEMDQNWEELAEKWKKHTTLKEYIYKQGDTFLTLSQCEETVCLYIVLEDVLRSEYTRFSTGDDRWQRITCMGTGFNKCMSYNRKKQPFDLYKVVQIGSKGDYVEVPVRYKPSPPIYETRT